MAGSELSHSCVSMPLLLWAHLGALAVEVAMGLIDSTWLFRDCRWHGSVTVLLKTQLSLIKRLLLPFAWCFAERWQNFLPQRSSKTNI